MRKCNTLWTHKNINAQIEVEHSCISQDDGMEFGQNRCPYCYSELNDGDCDICGYPEAYILHIKNNDNSQSAKKISSPHLEIEKNNQTRHKPTKVSFKPAFASK